MLARRTTHGHKLKLRIRCAHLVRNSCHYVWMHVKRRRRMRLFEVIVKHIKQLLPSTSGARTTALLLTAYVDGQMTTGGSIAAEPHQHDGRESLPSCSVVVRHAVTIS